MSHFTVRGNNDRRKENGGVNQHESRGCRDGGVKETLSKIRKCILTNESNMLDNQTPGG